MDDDQQFCLRWNNHQSTLISVFDTLLENGTLVDCTLAAEGKFLKAHKVVLSACSPYFASLLSQQYDKHPIFILKDVKFQELRAMMDYMYRGEVNISQDQLAALLKAAESLQIKGLSDSRSSTATTASSGSHKINEHKQQQQQLNVPGSITGKGVAGLSGGYTLEQKRPRHALGGQSSIESQELTGSREGSSSPTSRKRKKIRRRSVDNVMADNQEHSNSSSHSMQVNSSSNTAGAIATVSQGAIASSLAAASASGVTTIAGGSIVTTGGAIAGSGVTKKTESGSSGIKGIGGSDERETENDNDDNQGVSATVGGDHDKATISIKKDHIAAKRKSQQHQQSIDGKDSELLIEPKSEYDDGNDETVEDLTLDDEELLEDLEQAGPSHTGGEGSSQGYAQWQVDRSQDEVFMATQEAAGQQRDPQDLRTVFNMPQSPTSSRSPILISEKDVTTANMPSILTSLASSLSSSSSSPTFMTGSGSTSLLLPFIHEPEITIRKVYKCCNRNNSKKSNTSSTVNSSNHVEVLQQHCRECTISSSMLPLSSLGAVTVATSTITGGGSSSRSFVSDCGSSTAIYPSNSITTAAKQQSSRQIIPSLNSSLIFNSSGTGTNVNCGVISNSLQLPPSFCISGNNGNNISGSLNTNSGSRNGCNSQSTLYNDDNSRHHHHHHNHPLITAGTDALVGFSQVASATGAMLSGGNACSTASTVASSTTSSTSSSVAVAAAAAAATLLSQSLQNSLPKRNSTILFDCDYCSFTCTWKYDLKLHLRQKHGIHKKM